jgi:hypothetical protein
MTKQQMIAEIKTENPTLSYGIGDQVIEMSADQYEQTIANWADRRIAKEQEKAEVEAKATARASALAKLSALGLTADEIASL